MNCPQRPIRSKSPSVLVIAASQCVEKLSVIRDMCDELLVELDRVPPFFHARQKIESTSRNFTQFDIFSNVVASDTSNRGLTHLINNVTGIRTACPC